MSMVTMTDRLSFLQCALQVSGSDNTITLQDIPSKLVMGYNGSAAGGSAIMVAGKPTSWNMSSGMAARLPALIDTVLHHSELVSKHFTSLLIPGDHCIIILHFLPIFIYQRHIWKITDNVASGLPVSMFWS